MEDLEHFQVPVPVQVPAVDGVAAQKGEALDKAPLAHQVELLVRLLAKRRESVVPGKTSLVWNE